MKPWAVLLLLAWPCGLCALVWTLSPLAQVTVPPAVATVAAGAAGCLSSLGAWLGAAALLLAGGLAWRVSHPAPRRDVFLYPVEPPASLPAPPLIEGEYRYE